MAAWWNWTFLSLRRTTKCSDRLIAKARRGFFEPLEDRRLLAAAPVAGFANFGELTTDFQDYDASRILVRFQDEAASRGAAAALAGTQIGRAFPIVSGLREVTLPEGLSVEAALAAYRSQPNVLYAYPDYHLRLALTPNDPNYTNGTLWGLHNTGQNSGTADADIDAPEAWDVTTGSSSVIVAVIDTGVDYNHPDLAANMWHNPLDLPDAFDNDGNGLVDDYYGADFVNNDGDPMDDHYHGTHVAGTIGGVGNNGAGVAGVAWDVQIMALKFLNAQGSGTTSGAIAALNYAVAHGAKISNNSYGGGPFEQIMFDAVQSAAQLGHLFVAAAGNGDFLGRAQNNDTTPFYPSGYKPNPDAVIAVAATDRNDKFASWSNYGATSVDLAAPGVSIYSTSPGGSYRTLSGTSMAAPHVAGVAALVWSADPTLTALEVKDRILAGTDYIGDKNPTRPTLTNGRLNARQALQGGSGGGSITVAINDASVTEGNTGTVVAAFTVSLSKAAAADITVEFAATDGTATSPIDYTLTPGTLTIPAGATSGEILVAVNGDLDPELNETFFVNLLSAAGAGVTIADGQGVGTILDNEGLIGSDSTYVARVEAFRNIDLVPGAAGVTTLLSSGDDKNVNVGIGSNTFNFYGASYSSFYVSTNGLITFGSGNNSHSNSDLKSSPSQRSIAPLWDDWKHTSGNAIILGAFRDVDGDGNNEAIIEWNKVQGYSSSPSSVTFQVILWMNTGSSPSNFAFNYPDLNAGNSRSNGGSATVGIKNSGSQGPDRLLVSYNDGSGKNVGSGKAIRFSPLLATSSIAVAASDAALTDAGQGSRLGNTRTSRQTVEPPASRKNSVLQVARLDPGAADLVFSARSHGKQSGIGGPANNVDDDSWETLEELLQSLAK
jgi:subtilisin family serine protease